jgi:hypothetical protein
LLGIGVLAETFPTKAPFLPLCPQDGPPHSWLCRKNSGCFDAGTKIRMGDGTEKSIIDIHKGDLVWNPKTKLAQGVSFMSIGSEREPMLRVGMGGRFVEVTQTHPFYTRRGWLQAKNLRTGMQVWDADNSFRRLDLVEVMQSLVFPTVINLALNGVESEVNSHFVLANGMPVGDLIMQNAIEREH